MNPFMVLAAFVVCASVQPAFAEANADRLGMAMFREGRFAEAYRIWADAAVAGDGRAARLLGLTYDTGEGVHQDRAEAVRWYQRAAELGDVSGMFNVAVSFDSGRGVPQDRRVAAQWYARAAARHFGRAEYNLALMYADGDGVRRDPAAAARLFRAAAGDGIAAALSHLSGPRPAVTRTPVPDDNSIFLNAQRALISRAPADAASAVTLFRQAASRSGVTAQMAQYDLAWCYENGVGVPPDRSQAYSLYLRVAAGTSDPGLRDLAEAGAAGVRKAEVGATEPDGAQQASRSGEPETPAGHPGGSSD